ncbi:MAG: NADH:flavin oxidoreductase/NADH oxidase family protein [Myxococcota bacterium]
MSASVASAVVSPPLLISRPLPLPCGVTLPNRIAKAAMAELLADHHGAPTEGLVRLYSRWAKGGAGLLITGNVMVDPARLGEPGDVAVQDARDLPMLKRWAEAARSGGSQVWMQINHPGRQSMTPDPVAPSAVPMQVGGGVFKTPRALVESEIEDIVRRFATTASVAREAGFTGVEVHGAHGYLVNQFLSPRTNQRQDAWGGSLENRMRFLLEVVRAIRRVVGKDFPLAVKLNSADFQRGGFSEEDSMSVVRTLTGEGLDLLEVSGGTYESAAMTGVTPRKESTVAREAYFLDYAAKVRDLLNIPLMLTGGFRTTAGMEAALQEGAIDVVGMARPLAQEPDLPARLLEGTAARSQAQPRRTGIRYIDGLVEVSWYQQQLQRMGEGKDPDPTRGPWRVLATRFLSVGKDMLRPKRS